jgi:hypothetical protein
MFNQITKYIEENKMTFLIIVILGLLIINNIKINEVEYMSDLPSICTSNIYQLDVDQKKTYINKIDEEYNDLQILALSGIPEQKIKNTHFTLHTAGDGNYVIKNENNLFLSYSDDHDNIILDNSSKRFKFIDAKSAGVIDAEPGELLLTTESNKYIVMKDSLHLGYDTNNTIHLENITKDELKKIENENFINLPIFKLSCIN